MSDVGACSEDNRVTLGFLVVVVEEFGYIEYLVENRDPTIVVYIVFCYFFRDVVVA